MQILRDQFPSNWRNTNVRSVLAKAHRHSSVHAADRPGLGCKEKRFMDKSPTNGNGNGALIEVLAERIANLSKKVDEQAQTQKDAVDAALVTSQTAIKVALDTQEKTVNAAFAASEKAITKAEESQKEYNKTIGILQNDVVSLKESRSQGVGDKSAKTTDKAQFHWGIGLLVPTVIALLAALYHFAK
jgi:hypothetical protein